MSWSFALCFVAFAPAQLDDAQTAATPRYVVQRAAGEIDIDGRLDEDDWQAARSVGDFRFAWWEAGKKEQTEAKLLWDDTHLYVSFVCHDAHIYGEHTERDSPVYRDDCVEVFTAPNPDQPNNYFNIEMNVRGAFLRSTPSRRPRSRTERGWNAKGVRIAVTIDGTLNDDTDTDRRWVLEAAIPLANFASVAKSVPPAADQVWHLNLNRLGGKTNPQHSQWSPSKTPRPAFHAPQDFGRVSFSKSTAAE